MKFVFSVHSFILTARLVIPDGLARHQTIKPRHYTNRQEFPSGKVSWRPSDGKGRPFLSPDSCRLIPDGDRQEWLSLTVFPLFLTVFGRQECPCFSKPHVNEQWHWLFCMDGGLVRLAADPDLWVRSEGLVLARASFPFTYFWSS